MQHCIAHYIKYNNVKVCHIKHDMALVYTLPQAHIYNVPEAEISVFCGSVPLMPRDHN